MHAAVVDDQDFAGRMPLSYAAVIIEICPKFCCIFESIVEPLLDYNADVGIPNNEGRTPLSFAAERECSKCFALLLNARTSKTAINHRDNSGRTPLSYAAEEGRILNVQLLLEHQAKP